MTRPTVLVGYYGMRNFGDDLFVSLISALRPRVEDSSPLWIVAPPLSGVPAQGSRFLVPRHLAKAWRSHGVHGSVLRLVFNLFAAVVGQTVVLGGGSVLTTVDGVRAQQLRHRQLLGIRRWVALGVSVGPVEEEQRMGVDELLGVLDTLVVRDERSAADAQRASELGGDLAALIPSSPLAPDVTVTRQGIVYAPKHSWTADLQRILVGPSAALATANGKTVSIVALNCHEQDGDLAACATAAALFQQAGVLTRRISYEELGVRATVQALASASSVVTGRLHGGIVSFVTGTPFVLLSDTTKMDDFLDDIRVPTRLRGRLDPSGAQSVAELLKTPEQRPNDEYIARARAVYLVPPGTTRG
jgi:polysaccharide pyruvyl transferase WcaK-like protein